MLWSSYLTAQQRCTRVTKGVIVEAGQPRWCSQHEYALPARERASLWGAPDGTVSGSTFSLLLRKLRVGGERLALRMARAHTKGQGVVAIENVPWTFTKPYRR